MKVYQYDQSTGMYQGCIDTPEGVIPPCSTEISIPANYQPGDVYIWTGDWIKKHDGIAPISFYAPAQRPRLVITGICADDTNAASTTITPENNDVTCPAGTVLNISAQLQIGGEPLHVTTTFRMPIVARDGREKVLLVALEDGAGNFNAQMRESGVWEITESITNQALPLAEQMDFSGITIYVFDNS